MALTLTLTLTLALTLTLTLAGALDLAEFRAALDVMGVKLPGDKLRHVFEFFDADGDMHLDACEFCQARARLQRATTHA